MAAVGLNSRTPIRDGALTYAGSVRGDCQGVVMVEFLLAFMPIFLLFLGTVQIALAGAAHLVVQHAATVAARSAVVMIEDDPANHDLAPRRDLGSGESDLARIGALLALAQRSSLDRSGGTALGRLPSSPSGGETGVQRGARMAAVREAAYVPLLGLAPSQSSLMRPEDGSVAAALRTSGLHQVNSAIDYSRAAAVITLHSTAQATDTPPREFPKQDLVTARVTYFYHCGVPLVSALICDTLESMQERASETPVPTGASWRRLEYAEAGGTLAELAGAFDRFVALEGKASFPSQGADYAEQEEPE